MRQVHRPCSSDTLSRAERKEATRADHVTVAMELLEDRSFASGAGEPVADGGNDIGEHDPVDALHGATPPERHEVRRVGGVATDPIGVEVAELIE